MSLGRSNVSIECEGTLTGSSKLQMKKMLSLVKHPNEIQRRMKLRKDDEDRTESKEQHAPQKGRTAGIEERARRSDVPEEACRVVHGSSDMSKSSMTPFNGRLGGDYWDDAARSAARGSYASVPK